VWKTLHMLVYVAYALLVAHVTLGLLQSETSPLLAAGTGVGLFTVITLHWPLRDGKPKWIGRRSVPLRKGL